MWCVLAAATTAWAFESPNSTVGASVGTPWLVGGRAEGWFADELSGELGAGALGEADPFGFDVTVRWRPDVLCIACGSRALVTVGFGAAVLVDPDLELDGPWRWTVGPDLAATFVYWFSPAYGLAIGGRGGAGAAVEGDALNAWTVRPWAFGTLGLAF